MVISKCVCLLVGAGVVGGGSVGFGCLMVIGGSWCMIGSVGL